MKAGFIITIMTRTERNILQMAFINQKFEVPKKRIWDKYTKFALAYQK